MWALGATAFGHQSSADARGSGGARSEVPRAGSGHGGGAASHRSARARCVARRRGARAERVRATPRNDCVAVALTQAEREQESAGDVGAAPADAGVQPAAHAPSAGFSASAPPRVEEGASDVASRVSKTAAAAGSGRSYVLARRTAAVVTAQLGAAPATPPRHAARSPPALRRRVASPPLAPPAAAEPPQDAPAAAAALARAARTTPRGPAGDARRAALRGDPHWRALLSRSEALMPSMNLAQLSQCVWAVATLRAAPGDAWLGALLRHSAVALRAAAAGGADQRPAPRHVAHLAWGAASLGAAPPDTWLAALEAAAQDAASHPELSAANVSNLFWALATLNAAPSDATVDALCAAATRLLPDFAPQTVANVMFALGRLGRVPPCGLMQLLAAAVARDARRYAPEELSGAIWALGSLGLRQGPAWHAAFDAAAAARLAQPGFGARSVSVTLLSLSRLGHHPGRAALGAYCAELLRCAAQRRAGAQALANALFAFASLHNTLRDRWQAAQDAERDATPHDASPGRRAAEALPPDGDAGNPLPFPTPDALDALCAAAAPMLPACKPAELTQLLWALAQLGHDPGSSWRAAFCVAACGVEHDPAAAGGARLGPGLRRFGPRELAALLQSHAHLGVAPPPAFLDAWAAAAAPQWPAFEARHAVHAAWALAACDAGARCAAGGAALTAAWARLATACADAEAAGIAPEALMPRAGWAQAAQAALVCASAAARNEEGETADPLAALPPACRAACAAALRANARRGAASAMQRDVAATLFAGLGVAAQLEASAAAGAASLDIAIEAEALRGLPGVLPRRVALEVDGPCHDVRCGAAGGRRRSGGAALRSRALAALGWRPLVLRHDAWPRGFDARVEALRRLLRGQDDDGALVAASDAELAPAMQAALRRREAAGRSA